MSGTRIRCDYRNQIYTFDLGPGVRRIGTDDCFDARDISSKHPRLEPDTSSFEVTIRVLNSDDQAILRRWEEICAVYADCPLHAMLRLVAFGRMLDGPYAGRLMLATERWNQTLTQMLINGGTPLPGLASLYRDLSEVLFRLHGHGFAHGAVSTDNIVLVPAYGWKLAPGSMPENRLASALDVACGGEVVFRALGLPARTRGADSRPLRGAARYDALAVQWQSLRLGDIIEEKRPWYRRWFAPIEDKEDASKAVAEIPSEWQTILDGLLPRNPAGRWDAVRMLFAGNALPVVEELRVTTDGRTALVSWTPPASGEVALYERPAEPIPCGRVVPVSAMRGYGPPLAVFPRGAEPVHRFHNLDERRLQAITHLEELVVGGTDVRWNRLPDVSGLEVHTREGFLWARWEWPQGADVACVVIRTDRFATSPVGERHVQEIARRAYSNGGFRMQVPIPGVELFVSVFTIQRTQAGVTLSPGATAESRWRGIGKRVRVRYSIDPSGWLGSFPGQRSYLLCLTAEDAVTLPELRLSGELAASPIRVEEGCLLRRFPGGRDLLPGRTLRLRFRLAGEQSWWARLFATGPQADGLELVGSPKGVRLG